MLSPYFSNVDSTRILTEFLTLEMITLVKKSLPNFIQFIEQNIYLHYQFSPHSLLYFQQCFSPPRPRSSFLDLFFFLKRSIHIFSGIESGGFRCNHNTIHLQCHACGGMMPSRPPATTVPQHCKILLFVMNRDTNYHKFHLNSRLNAFVQRLFCKVV